MMKARHRRRKKLLINHVASPLKMNPFLVLPKLAAAKEPQDQSLKALHAVWCSSAMAEPNCKGTPDPAIMGCAVSSP